MLTGADARESDAAVLCRPLPRPEHVSKFVYLGLEYVADGQLRVSPRDFAVQRFLPEMMCGSILTVVCEENYVPESFKLGNDCTNNSFDMRYTPDSQPCARSKINVLAISVQMSTGEEMTFVTCAAVMGWATGKAFKSAFQKCVWS